MPRFVILEHDHPFPHWDLMLEAGGTLRTWRLLAEPLPGRTVEAEALGDHRLAYLDYEGPVSGNRGCVRRWDAGTFEWVEDSTALRLAGGRCRGEAVLEQTAGGKWTFAITRPTIRDASQKR